MKNHNPEIGSFRFISSYKGCFDYGITFRDGQTSRICIRAHREEYGPYCNLSAEDWESEVNGKVGLASMMSVDRLTEDLVVEFNRWSFQKYQAEVDQILANPKRYGDYTPEPFPIYVGARFDLQEKRWIVLHEFDTVRLKAGIPESKCRNPRKNLGQLKLAA